MVITYCHLTLDLRFFGNLIDSISPWICCLFYCRIVHNRHIFHTFTAKIKTFSNIEFCIKTMSKVSLMKPLKVFGHIYHLFQSNLVEFDWQVKIQQCVKKNISKKHYLHVHKSYWDIFFWFVPPLQHYVIKSL